MLDALHNLSIATLRTIAASLRDGPLAVGLSRHTLAQVIGPQAAAVHGNLEELQKQGMTPAQIAGCYCGCWLGWFTGPSVCQAALPTKTGPH
jgi:hypothetical protein